MHLSWVTGNPSRQNDPSDIHLYCTYSSIIRKVYSQADKEKKRQECVKESQRQRSRAVVVGQKKKVAIHVTTTAVTEYRRTNVQKQTKHQRSMMITKHSALPSCCCFVVDFSNNAINNIWYLWDVQHTSCWISPWSQRSTTMRVLRLYSYLARIHRVLAVEFFVFSSSRIPSDMGYSNIWYLGIPTYNQQRYLPVGYEYCCKIRINDTRIIQVQVRVLTSTSV